MASKPIVLADMRGGRNGTDAPMTLPMNQAVEAVNVDWKDTAFARKRGGCTSVSLSGGTAFGSGLQTLIRHVPGSSEAAAELWAVDGANLVKRLTGGTSWADVTLDDAIASRPQDVVGVTLNGKLFLFYDSSTDRPHVYDPTLGSPRVRRVGLQTPTAAPTVANTGAGAYAANPRYYRVRWIQTSGSRTIRRSEAGAASTVFTPSGAGAAARVTRPTAPGEGETAWELELSTDNATWYLLGPVAIASTTYDDSSDPATIIAAGLPSDPAGMYALPPSAKYATTDGNRLLMAGAWESGGYTSRVWYTPVLGSSDDGDDERVPNQTTQKNWVDLNENDGGGITGLSAPLNGLVWAFKYRQVHKLRPTGDVTSPYLPRRVRDDVGCINHKTIATGEDQIGRAAVYFLSHRGPYRVTQDGDVEYLGRDNEDIWRTMNLDASSVVAHSVFYPDLHQWWLWLATGSSTSPDTAMVFDVQLGLPDGHGQVRGGWAKYTGNLAGAQCSAMFASTLGASMSSALKPHIGRSTGTTLYKADTSDLDDAGTAFQAYVTTRPLTTTVDLMSKVGVSESIVAAKVTSNTSVSLTIVRDYGKETRTHSVSLAAASTESRVIQKVEGSAMGEANVVQITIGDASAVASAWTLDSVVVPVRGQEPR